MKRLWRALVLVFLPALPLPAAQADLRGIYIYTNDVSQVSNATASHSGSHWKIRGISVARHVPVAPSVRLYSANAHSMD